jgi:hypothetical protein
MKSSRDTFCATLLPTHVKNSLLPAMLLAEGNELSCFPEVAIKIIPFF